VAASTTPQAARAPILTGVYDSASRITIDFDPGPPINGSLQTGSGLHRPFSGWLGLLAALETALSGSSPPARPDDQDGLSVGTDLR
jgi:hypothetical protein